MTLYIKGNRKIEFRVQVAKIGQDAVELSFSTYVEGELMRREVQPLATGDVYSQKYQLNIDQELVVKPLANGMMQ